MRRTHEEKWSLGGKEQREGGMTWGGGRHIQEERGQVEIVFTKRKRGARLARRGP